MAGDIMKIDSELQNAFPGLRVLELRMAGLTIKSSDPRLEAFKLQVQNDVRLRISALEKIKEQPIFRAYRDFFWRVGIDPTKIRPAGEALTRRILAGRDLPRVNTVVDAYNLASVQTSIAIAAFDGERVNVDSLMMRRAAKDEPFYGIGMDSPGLLTGVEVAIEDMVSHNLVAVYPYRDSEASKITERTTDVLFVMCGVPGIETSSLEEACELTNEYVAKFCRSSPEK
jgi:DNA/RNA-binding domain of Phe-tRNA-synthetase-like protein